MKKLKVSNFGPILDGYTDSENGFMDIERVTLFCGRQGSGKSCITKLISLFSWLEKSLFRLNITKEEIVKYNRFRKVYCSYHNIQNYFHDNTRLYYSGDAYEFGYYDGKFHCSERVGYRDRYISPKIMYVPAERNFMSVVEDAGKLKNLPSPLYTLLDRYDKARKELKDKIALPINDTYFKYDKVKKQSWISGESFRIQLSEASSGFQAIVPLYLVSQYLAKSFDSKEDESKNRLSLEEIDRIKNEIRKKMKAAGEISTTLIDEIISGFLPQLSNSYFMNIVEEPEQNIYPTKPKATAF